MEGKSVAYTEKEKLLLISIIDKHKIVENKKTDASTIQAKNEEWEKIMVEYNSQGNLINNPRNATQLKKLWNNLKQRKRKATTEIKYMRLLTGGGSPPKEYTDPIMDAVDVAAPHADVEVECLWDSTAQFQNSNTNSNVPTATGKDNAVTYEFSAESLMNTNIGSISATTSTTNPYTPVTPKNKRVDVNLIQKECDLRIKKLKDAILQQEELHNIRLRIENEMLRKVSAECRKVEAEEELAVLKLEQFKKQNLL